MNRKRFLDFCRAFPGATEDVKWGADLCFCVGGKIFAATGLEGTSVSLKVTPELFDVLVTQPGVEPSSHLARYKWVRVEDHTAHPDEELERLVRGSYELVFAKLPAKVRRQIRP